MECLFIIISMFLFFGYVFGVIGFYLTCLVDLVFLVISRKSLATTSFGGCVLALSFCVAGFLWRDLGGFLHSDWVALTLLAAAFFPNLVFVCLSDVKNAWWNDIRRASALVFFSGLALIILFGFGLFCLH